MTEEGNFSSTRSIAKNACPDCGQRMERKETGSFVTGDDKYRCINIECPGKHQNHEGNGYVRKSDRRGDAGRS